MNIIYKFTSIRTGKFYIGSKTECTVIDNTIYDRLGKAYFTSSQTEELLDEFANGNMVLEVLEYCSNREDLLSREAYHQRLFNAVENPESYNLVYADLRDKDGVGLRYGKSFNRSSHEGYGNIYKESIKEITWKNRVVSRKDTHAQKFSFNNYGSMYKTMLELKDSGKSYAEIDRELNMNKFSARTIKNLHIDDYTQSIDLPKVKEYLSKGKTLLKICQDMDYKDHVVRYELGGYNLKSLITVEDKVAVNNGFVDRQELDKFIMREYLSGKGVNQISKSMKNISSSTCQRVIERIVRERLKISDFE